MYELAKCRTRATNLSVSPDGMHFAVTARDCKVCRASATTSLACQPLRRALSRQIRVFAVQSGKLRRKYDEALQVMEQAQREGRLGLDAVDFGRRAALERELLVGAPLPPPSPPGCP